MARYNRPTPENSKTRINTSEKSKLPTIPSVNEFCQIAINIMEQDNFKNAHTVQLLTDSRELSCQCISKHFELIGPILLDRTTIIGSFGEQWTCIFEQTNKLQDNIHTTWAAVFILEALATAAPFKHYVLC